MHASKFCLLVLLAALGGCDYFNPTTIPTSDSSKPWAVVTHYRDGDYEDLRVGDRGLVDAATQTITESVTSDPFEFSIAIAAGVDSGGMHEVQMSSRVYYRCLYGWAPLVIIQPWQTTTATQAGSPGQTVSDGRYLYKGFSGAEHTSSVGSCPSDAYRITLEWYARAEDFHGNVAHMGLAKLTYIDWGG